MAVEINLPSITHIFYVPCFQIVNKLQSDKMASVMKVYKVGVYVIEFMYAEKIGPIDTC